MYIYSNRNDNPMFNLDNCSNCYDYEEPSYGMRLRDIDLLYIIADEVFDYSPRFRNETEKYSIENERFLLCLLASECMSYVLNCCL